LTKKITGANFRRNGEEKQTTFASLREEEARKRPKWVISESLERKKGERHFEDEGKGSSTLCQEHEKQARKQPLP